jgi:hypothetical protein
MTKPSKPYTEMREITFRFNATGLSGGIEVQNAEVISDDILTGSPRRRWPSVRSGGWMARIIGNDKGKKRMDQDTFDGTIRAFKHRTPFRPFTVAMVNGDRFEVDHPDALAVRGGIALFAAPGNVPMIFDNEGVSEIIGDLSGRSAEAQ